MKKDNIFKRVWLCSYPLLFWFINQFIFTLLFEVFYIVKAIINNDITALSIENTMAFMEEKTLIILLISSLINILFFGAVLYEKKRLNIKKELLENNKKLILICVLMSIGFYMSISGFIDLFNLTKYFTDYNSSVEVLLSGNIILNIISVCILAPISEEFILRGVVYNNIRKYLDVPMALLLQGVLFGIIHMNLLQCLYAIILGMILGYIYEKTGSIIYSSIFHMIFNLCNHIFDLPILNSLYSISSLMVIMGIILIVVTFKKFKKENIKEKLYY